MKPCLWKSRYFTRPDRVSNSIREDLRGCYRKRAFEKRFGRANFGHVMTECWKLWKVRVCTHVRVSACTCTRRSCVFKTPVFLCLTCVLHMELMNSRCRECKAQTYQCGNCFSNDKTAKKDAREEARKKRSRSAIPATILFAADPVALSPVALSVALSPVALSPVAFAPAPISDAERFNAFVSPPPNRQYDLNHVFPPMPSPTPVSFNGLALYPILPENPKVPPKASANLAPKRRAVRADEFDLSDDADSAASNGQCSDSATGDEDDEAKASGFEKKPQKMGRITKVERECVCDWILKDRKDGKVLCTRSSTPLPRYLM